MSENANGGDLASAAEGPRHLDDVRIDGRRHRGTCQQADGTGAGHLAISAGGIGHRWVAWLSAREYWACKAGKSADAAVDEPAVAERRHTTSAVAEAGEEATRPFGS